MESSTSLSSGKRLAFLVLLLGATAFFVWVAIAMDLYGIGAVHNWLLFPAQLIFAVPALLCLAFLRSRPLTIAFWVLVALVLGSTFVPWNPHKRFIRDLHAVEEGMSFEEVDTIMAGYELRTDSEVVFEQGRDEDAAHDDWRRSYSYEGGGAHVGSVAFRDGRVFGVNFSPD